ncbi:hypothetical protein AB0K68_17000 [Streptomyces sp. NPDC050698]
MLEVFVGPLGSSSVRSRWCPGRQHALLCGEFTGRKMQQGLFYRLLGSVNATAEPAVTKKGDVTERSHPFAVLDR